MCGPSDCRASGRWREPARLSRRVPKLSRRRLWQHRQRQWECSLRVLPRGRRVLHPRPGGRNTGRVIPERRMPARPACHWLLSNWRRVPSRRLCQVSGVRGQFSCHLRDWPIRVGRPASWRFARRRRLRRWRLKRKAMFSYCLYLLLVTWREVVTSGSRGNAWAAQRGGWLPDR